jgi:hypothetical protein
MQQAQGRGKPSLEFSHFSALKGSLWLLWAENHSFPYKAPWYITVVWLPLQNNEAGRPKQDFYSSQLWKPRSWSRCGRFGSGEGSVPGVQRKPPHWPLLCARTWREKERDIDIHNNRNREREKKTMRNLVSPSLIRMPSPWIKALYLRHHLILVSSFP